MSCAQEQVRTIEFERVDAFGKKFQVTRVVRSKLVTGKVNVGVAERKKWNKFGVAKGKPAGPDSESTNIGDEIFLKLGVGIDFDSVTEDALDVAAKASSRKVACRHCQGDHWTRECPFKDSLEALKSNDSATAQESSSSVSNTDGKYIAPSLRARAEGTATKDDTSSFALRVTNLSEDVVESDLADLFSGFGMISRMYLSKDHHTGKCKGFAFVNYMCKEDAAKALAFLNKHRYDNLILDVEWAAARKQ